MARISTFGFTNNSDSTHKVTPKLLGMVSNYAVTEELARSAVLNNKTAPIDQEEIISFRSKDIDFITTQLNIQNPAKVRNAMQYSVQIEDVLTTTDDADPTFRVDEPIVVTATFRHPKSGNINSDIIAQVFTRLISTLTRADGTWRFDDLMRSAERPVVD